MKGAERYLVDQVRGRMDFMTAVKALREMSVKYPQARAKYIEDKANGPAVISALKSEVQGGLIPVNPRGSKVSRALAVTPMLEAGNVYLKRSEFADELIEEAALFPAGKHDDMVDAMTQALSSTEKRQTPPSASFAGQVGNQERYLNNIKEL